jgi:hypothetical protein
VHGDDQSRLAQGRCLLKRQLCHSPSVFDHVTIRASTRSASERFYEAVLPTLGLEKTAVDEHYTEWDDFSLAQSNEDKPVTRGVHIGLVARSRDLVDAFWRVGTEAGYPDDGAPGLRPHRHYFRMRVVPGTRTR